jgi:hypothetical protein
MAAFVAKHGHIHTKSPPKVCDGASQKHRSRTHMSASHVQAMLTREPDHFQHICWIGPVSVHKLFTGEVKPFMGRLGAQLVQGGQFVRGCPRPQKHRHFNATRGIG